MRIAELLDVLWRDHVTTTPQAARIHHLLAERGEILCNDHIALRTYALPGIGIDALARPFEALGWRARDRYRSRGKHLRASYWQHDDDDVPRVLISELAIEELSPGAQAVIGALARPRPAALDERSAQPWAWRPGRITHASYRALFAESEYAAWVAAFGPGVHHFTVDIASLSTFPDLEALAAFLTEHGFRVDDAAGAIKGSRTTRLEQLSTRAEPVAVEFADRIARIPSGHYEFARRYRLPSGGLFPGFVPPSERSFESSDAGVSM